MILELAAEKAKVNQRAKLARLAVAARAERENLIRHLQASIRHLHRLLPTPDAALVAQLHEARQTASRPTFCRAFAYGAESCKNPDGCCPNGAHIPRDMAMKIDGFRKQWKEDKSFRSATPAPKAEAKAKAKAEPKAKATAKENRDRASTPAARKRKTD